MLSQAMRFPGNGLSRCLCGSGCWPYLFVLGPYIRWRLLLFSIPRLNLQNEYSWDSFIHAVGTRYKTPIRPSIHDSRPFVNMPTSRSLKSELSTKAKGGAIAGGLTAWNLTMFQRQKTIDRLKTFENIRHSSQRGRTLLRHP